MTLISGGCACSAVRYEVNEPFVSSNYCHCTRTSMEIGEREEIFQRRG